MKSWSRRCTWVGEATQRLGGSPASQEPQQPKRRPQQMEAPSQTTRPVQMERRPLRVERRPLRVECRALRKEAPSAPEKPQEPLPAGAAALLRAPLPDLPAQP